MEVSRLLDATYSFQFETEIGPVLDGFTLGFLLGDTISAKMITVTDFFVSIISFCICFFKLTDVVCGLIQISVFEI